jgi:orotidine-5'-phosphate decarboxylase
MKKIGPQTPASSRLIVAADFRPDSDGPTGIRRKVLNLGHKLRGLGVIIKLNFALRACGYELIQEIHNLGLEVMADLKLHDTPQTMENDALMLDQYQPDYLTVMAAAGYEGLERVQAITSDTTEVMAVTVLTSLRHWESKDIFDLPTEQAVINLSWLAYQTGIRSIVCSPKEAAFIRMEDGLDICINTPGVRPAWAVVIDDDQARTATVEEAIRAGADRIIMGRPIVEASDPHEAIQRSINEIEIALSPPPH